MKSSISFLVLTVICICAATAASARPTADPAKLTLQNLQTAFNGESNAHARYLAFAEKADQEGYFQIASLFRAAAKAEGIHANNHEVEIKRLGGTAQAKIEKTDVKSTKENLEAAIKGETYERDVMYPDFYKQARAVGDAGAVQTFNYARGAETEHAALFTNALGNMATMRVKGVTYYVCTVCGYTTTNMDFAKCHTCFSSKDKYVAVS
jgi:rubrerythrin